MCYHADFAPSRSNRAGVSKGSQKLRNAVASPPLNRSVTDP